MTAAAGGGGGGQIVGKGREAFNLVSLPIPMRVNIVLGQDRMKLKLSFYASGSGREVTSVGAWFKDLVKAMAIKCPQTSVNPAIPRLVGAIFSK
jgi:hypothetical protein